ncbi:MAG: adenylate/guanylate cyclase domain-containing protein, partial [Acidimicrobiia bacterium]
MAWSLTSFLEIGSLSTDSEDVALQKRMLVGAAGPVMVAAALWGLVYLILNEPLAASIPGGYAVLTAISLGVFAKTKRYRWFRTT